MDRLNPETGNVASIKSYDTAAQSHQTTEGLSGRINKDINKVVNFAGRRWGGTDITLDDISSRTIEVALPPTKLTPPQAAAIGASREYAASKGVELIVTVVK